jgi:hypothetical protein
MWYHNMEAASAFFQVIQEYYESGRRGEIQVKLSRGDSAAGSVQVDATSPFRHFSCLIDGVDAKHIDALVDCLAHLPYIFIATGYTSEDGEDHILPKCQYSTSTVIVDGRTVSGTFGETPYPRLQW